MIPIIAAAIALQMQIPPITKPVAPKATCSIKTVSYKFTGAPGTEFRYEGAKYVIPATGEIELIAGKKTAQAEYAGNRVQLDLFPVDEFGARTVPLPLPQPAPSTTAVPTIAKGE